MWWIAPITAGIAAYRFFSIDNAGLGWVSVLIAIAGLWSAGIAANFARGQEQAIPDGATLVSLIATLGGAALLIASFFL